ncbi:MAG: IPT/TIG domain-containing protein, partial [Nitrososphaerales archaeon]
MSRWKLFPLTGFLLCIGLSGTGLIDFANAVASISLSPTSGPAGSSVTVTGSGFAPNTLTAILFDNSFVDEK